MAGHTSRVSSAYEVPRRQWRSAWVVALAAISVAGMSVTPLRNAGLSSVQLESTCFFVGVLGGIGWQGLNRQDFVDRFLGWSALLVFAMLLALLPGTEVGLTEGSSVLPGTIAGVILAEGWMRLRARP